MGKFCLISPAPPANSAQLNSKVTPICDDSRDVHASEDELKYLDIYDGVQGCSLDAGKRRGMQHNRTPAITRTRK